MPFDFPRTKLPPRTSTQVRSRANPAVAVRPQDTPATLFPSTLVRVFLSRVTLGRAQCLSSVPMTAWQTTSSPVLEELCIRLLQIPQETIRFPQPCYTPIAAVIQESYGESHSSPCLPLPMESRRAAD